MGQATKIRREKVSEYLIKNVSETKIAQDLGVSRQTIVRDVAFFKGHAHDWLDGLAEDGFIFEYKLALEKLKADETRLQDLYDKTNDALVKLAIIRELNRNIKIYLELLGGTPTIHAFRQVLKRSVIGNVSGS